jgi:hypothetical protein
VIAVQKRSGKRHLIHPDGLATRCGRIIRRTGWTVTDGRKCDCSHCQQSLDADRRRTR